MARRTTRIRSSRRAVRLDFGAIEIIGGLLTPDIIGRIAAFEAQGQDEESYRVPPGLKIRDEIARYFRIGEALWAKFSTARTASPAASDKFVFDLLQQCFGFDALKAQATVHMGEREFPVRHAALEGRVPIVIAPVPPATARRSGLDESLQQFGDGTRRRSATLLLQEYLNAADDCLWGLTLDGTTLRLMRDNVSLTRPAWIEADLEKIFSEGLFPDFSALFLLIHQSRFGKPSSPPTECSLEQWRDIGRVEGVAARDKLRRGVEAALIELGQGFIEHQANGALRQALTDGKLSRQGYFEELLRLVYRMIFLFAAEDRELLHAPGALQAATKAYAEGYSLARLRERCMRRTAWDRHTDAWEGLKATFSALGKGQPRLGLPALGGLFASDQLTNLTACKLDNRRMLAAIWRLAWMRPDGHPLTRVNWRDMETEELGSVYESLLELTPIASADTRTFTFAEGDETRGNARKVSGSYYTPDSLVQALLNESLDPVLDAAEARTPGDPTSEILKLTIVDPACGSGHFLLGAARRAADRIAKHRSASTPSQQEYQHALREVVSHCIFGVDRNPMAVELCRVALWIEALEPGKPLTFLDNHIRCGDSLLGVFDLSVLNSGIPDDAYKQQPGDLKEAAAAYRSKNKKESQERAEVEAAQLLSKNHTALSSAFEVLQDSHEDTLDEITEKRRKFNELMARDGNAGQLRSACNLWAAAWFIPKSEEPKLGRQTASTSGQIWQYLRGEAVPTGMLEAADSASQRHRFFHWPVEFASIMAKGGFDVVIGNPPWERVEVQEQEFFASTHPEIANAPNAAKRKNLIEALQADDRHAFAAWQMALRTASTEVAFYKDSKRFPLGSPGKINTYAIFADLFRQLVKPEGMAGLILPTGIVGGFTYRDFLGHLLKNKTIAAFYGFENEDLLFPHVTNKVKFGILIVSGSARKNVTPYFTAHIRQPSEIGDPLKRYTLRVEDIEAINPNTLNLPAFRWARDAEVTASIHKSAPVLIRKNASENDDNPWCVKFMTLFNMATDSGAFIDHSAIAHSIRQRRGALAILDDGREVYPLYEGKMLWNFDHRYGTYEGQTEKQSNKGVLPRVSDQQHNDPLYRIQPLYWVDAKLTLETLGNHANTNWFFSWRDVGPSERTFVGTVIPRSAVGHAAPILVSDTPPESQIALYAILSSLVVDYAARQKSNRMTFFVVEQLPVIEPTSLLMDQAWLGATPGSWLSKRGIELWYTNEELSGFAESLGVRHPPFEWHAERRSLLQAEIDAALLHLYHLNREQSEWLIDSFTVLRKYEERDFGEFRTKRLVLEIFDEMARSKRECRPYNTRLEPPPGDPKCSHPENAGTDKRSHDNLGR